MNRLSLVTLGLVGLSCKHATPPPAAPTVQTVRPVATGPCVASLSESRADTAFPTALVKDGAQCALYQRIEERHCPSVYVAIVDEGGYGGSTRYFDGDKKLIGVWARSDTNQYCNGTSFDILFGTRPTCPTTEIVTDLCRRPL